MKQKLFTFFFALVASVSAIYASNTQVDGIWYDFFNSNKTAAVTYRGSSDDSYTNEYSGSVVIPSSVTYNGTTYSVTSIGNNAFYRCSSLTSVTIGESVTRIGDYAFKDCSSLTSITIPNSVTSIGIYAFRDCSSLTSITIPNSVTSIGYSAFHSCSSLTSVTIPNSVTSIANSTFYNCSSLTSIAIPESVTSIGYSAFFNCSSLTSVTIHKSVTSIGNGAFYSCSSLTSMVVESGNTTYDSRENCNAIIETATNTLIVGCQNTVIPESVTSIGESAFEDCSSLVSITIPNSVTSIGYSAFYACSSLTSVTIGESVTSIEHYAFSRCSSLASITIPESVTNIGNYAFEGCSSLTSVTIGESVPSIGEKTFYNCSSLTSITCEATTPPTIGGTYTFDGVPISIPVYVPCGCVKAYKAANGWKDFTNIQEPLAEYSITVDVNDTIMGSAKVDKNTICDAAQISATPNIDYHFVQWSDGNTENLRTLELTQDTILTAEFAPNIYTITTVSSDTQRGTTQGDTTVNYLEYITISASASYGYHFVQWNDGNSDNPRQVQVTGNTTYTATFAKNTYAISLSCNEEQGSVEGVTSAEYLDTVTISATPNIGYHFVQWSDGVTDNPRTLELTQDTILTAEFAQSFSGQCGDSLYWELIDTTLQITGKGEMYDYKSDSAPWKLLVSSIKVLTIAEDVTKIGYDAFDACTALVTIVWNAKHAADAYIDGQYVYPIFSGIRSQITSFTFGEAVEYIPSYLCSGMENLTSVTIPESVTSIGYAAFYNCTSLTSVTIPNSVTSIGKYAFYGCSSLTSVTIPNSVTSIGDDAFSSCNNITSVTWNAKNCNTYNFGSQVTSFEFGNEVEVVPSSLCKGMEKLTSVTIPNSVKTIGASAFEGCARLGKISLGTGLKEIAANAFAGCTRLYDIYSYATYPPFAEESSFANYNVYVYVPCDSKRDYTLDPVWGKFKFIECIDSEDATTDGDVTVVPGYNDVTITWPTEDNADTYSLVINKDNQPFCTLTFNQEGQLLNIAFAPSRDGNNRPAPYAEQAVNGYRFTVTGLSEATQYAYNITTKDAANKTIATYSGEFTTMGGNTTAVEDILQNTTNVQKLLRNGQLIIVRDGVEYTVMGQEL